MLDGIARIPAPVFAYDKQGIEKICIVFLVIDRLEVGRLVAAAQRGIAIHVMGVPIPEMFDLGMDSFDLPEHPFLIVPILKEAGRRPCCLGPGVQDALHLNLVAARGMIVSADHPTSGLIDVVAIALVENSFESTASNRNLKGRFPGSKRHEATLLSPQTAQCCCGVRSIRCN